MNHKATKDFMADRIQSDFSYHSPKPESLPKFQAIRELAKSLATLIVETVPMSREQSIALTSLEETVMWANAGIARNQE